MTAKKVLFVTEGKTDAKIVVRHYRRALRLLNENVVTYKYKTNIYDLYNYIYEDDSTTFLSILWERDKSQFPKDIIKPEDAFSSVYLIFDFDPQAPLFSLKKCRDLIDYFSDETRNGKLYFNYPMLESIYDFPTMHFSSFKNKTISLKECKSDAYKAHVNTTSFLNKNGNIPAYIKNETLYGIIQLHMKKHDFLVARPFQNQWLEQSSQKEIFNAQEKYYKNKKVSIINTSILLIPDYSIDALEALRKK